MILLHDGVVIERTGEKLLYSEMAEINISDGGWSKKRVVIDTYGGEFVFEINDVKAVPLKEILEDNIDNQTHDEFDDSHMRPARIRAGEAKHQVAFLDRVRC